MALEKTIEYKGISVLNAYIKVGRFEGTKEQLTFGVWYQASASSEPFDSKTLTCAYELSGKDPIAQAYDYIKTLPEFAGAGNC